MKLLMYSHDTYGLGNIRRMLAIATYLSESDDGLSILLVSGSPMLHAFRIPAQIDYVKLPCLARTESGEYVSPYLDLDFDQVIRLRSNLILSTVLDFQPDMLLVDKKPLGLGGELAPALRILDRRIDRPRKILLLRDILDSPEVTRAIWQKNAYFDVLASSYEAILVVGEREIFDVAAEYDFPPAIASKTEYCGYLERPPGRRNHAEIRRELGIGDEQLVLVTAGGGADGCNLLTHYLQGLCHAGDSNNFHSLVLTGSEMSAPECRFIKKLAAACPNVHLQEFTDDIMSYMSAAEVVVSMGGYNTVCELLTLKKCAIIVPRTTPVMEQCIRAERLAERRLVTTIHPNELTPAVLFKAVTDRLRCRDAEKNRMYQIEMNGLENIRNNLLRLVALSPRKINAHAGSPQYSQTELTPLRDLAVPNR